MILLHPCRTCPSGLTEHRDTDCLRCRAKFEAEFNPNDRPAATPKSKRRWLRRKETA